MDPKIKIIGLGSAGSKVMKRVRERLENNSFEGVECLAFDCGEDAAEVFSREDFDLVLFVAGLGRTTGSEEILRLGRLAHEKGIDVGAFVSTPFRFEGQQASRKAGETLLAMEGSFHFYNVLDCAGVLRELLSEDKGCATVDDAFKVIDQRLSDRVFRFVCLLKNRGLIVTDYEDVRVILGCRKKVSARLHFLDVTVSDKSLVGKRIAESMPRDMALGTVQGMLVHIEHGEGLTLQEYDSIVGCVYENLVQDDDTNVIISDILNSSMDRDIRINVWIV